MKHFSLLTVAGCVFAAVFGCANDNVLSGDNRLVGHELTREDTFYSDSYGIVGNLNKVRLKNGTKISYLKIVGDANEVFCEDMVILAKIEIWGINNTVSIPGDLVTREAVVGHGNKIIRRPRPTAPAAGTPLPGAVEVIEPTGNTPAAPQPAGAQPGAAQPAPGSNVHVIRANETGGTQPSDGGTLIIP